MIFGVNVSIEHDAHYFMTINDSNDKIIGVIMITEKIESIFLSGLAILPEYQRQGIGRVLLGRALEWCKKNYCVKTISLQVLKKEYSNTDTPTVILINFYESFGFVINEESDKYFELTKYII